MEYEYLVIGAGLFGAVFAHEMAKKGKRCAVVERRGRVAGNAYTEKVEGIDVHRYGAHIFHTSDQGVWAYVNQFAEFNHYINSPLAVYRDELYNLPFNMNTFHALWGVRTPAEARAKIAEQVAAAGITEPGNLEEQALQLVGRDIYEKLIRGYTEKQWGRSCRDLPASILQRLPVRYTYDNNYFRDRYQGIPTDGYTRLVEKLLEGIPVFLRTDYLKTRGDWQGRFGTLVFTGPIDAYYEFSEGALEYRSLRFETKLLAVENYQGNAVVNYTEREIPYTRVIEHKHFNFGTQAQTVVTWEYPAAWQPGAEPYYTVNDAHNNALYARYAARAATEPGVLFGGRLGSYRYYDMDQAVRAALDMADMEINR